MIAHPADTSGQGILPSWMIWIMSNRTVEIAALLQLVIPVTHVQPVAGIPGTLPEAEQVD